jgi:hypothetical protein
MNEEEFITLQNRAKLLPDGDYQTGYRRGIRRKYHGESFGTPDEHAEWMTFGCNGDMKRTELGRGYRDGYAGCSAPAIDEVIA